MQIQLSWSANTAISHVATAKPATGTANLHLGMAYFCRIIAKREENKKNIALPQIS
jgi:hypothetical protein